MPEQDSTSTTRRERPDTGGPAFPRPVSDDRTQGDQPDGNKTIDEQDGMDLRDYFAAKAMHALMSADLGAVLRAMCDTMNSGAADKLAITAFLFADAMLRARKAVQS